MAGMTLKQLEAFYWAATCASFAVAAQRLHLSLSSLSKRIAELEGSLGQALFDRSGHRAALTDAGSHLLPQAGQLLQAAESVRLSVAQRTGLHGLCRFGVGELTALTWLPRLVRRMQQQHPGLTPEPAVDIGEVLERRVEAGELDFAIVAGRSSRSGITSVPVAQALFAWCAAPALVGRARTLSPALLTDHALVTLPTGAGTTRILDDWLAAQLGGLSPRRLVCNHWGGVAGMLVEGAGIGLLPQAWAWALQRRGALRVLVAKPALAPLPYAFQWRRDDARPVVAALRELAQASADFSVAGALF
jgi:DNA-binding transcriptional LysR family regulator